MRERLNSHIDDFKRAVSAHAASEGTSQAHSFAAVAARLLSRYSIGKRIYFGFGVLLVLLILVSLMGFIGLGRTSGAFSSYEKTAGNAVTVSVIDRTVVSMLSAVLRYTGSNGDDKVLPQLRELQKEISPLLAEAEKKAEDDHYKQTIGEVSMLATSYVANIEKLVEIKKKRDHLVNEVMAPLGDQAAERLSGIIRSSMDYDDNRGAALAGIAQESLMKARLTANRYIVTPTPELVAQAQKEIDAFAKASDTLAGYIIDPTLLDQANAAGAAGPKFRAAFLEMVAAVEQADKLMNGVMAAESAKIAALTTEAGQEQRQELIDKTEHTVTEITATRVMAVILALGATMAALVLAWLVGAGIVPPVRAITATMKRLAEGDRSLPTPATDYQDEIGDMARAVEVFKQNAQAMERLREENEAQKRRAEEERHRDMLALADSFEQSVQGIVGIVSSQSGELEKAARSLSTVAADAAKDASSVASASQQASENVSAVASTMVEVSQSILEIGRQVEQSSTISQNAAVEAERVDVMVNSLSAAATKIGDIVELISSIASQTNLLALNATIEAARAGEMGKGFAVVAMEVKSLADQTSKATGEISAQVGSVQAATQEAVEAIHGITSTIKRLNEIATAISSAVEEQGAATQEIERNVQQASSGVREVNGSIGLVTEASEHTGKGSSQVLASARELSKQSESLRAEVDNFIKRIRA